MGPAVKLDKHGRKLTAKVTKNHPYWAYASEAVRSVAKDGVGAYNPKGDRYEFGFSALKPLLDALSQLEVEMGDDLETWRIQQAEIADSEYSIPDAPEPWAEHQVEGILYSLRNTSALVLDDQGLGKTRQAAATVVVRMDIGAVRRTVVVCPNSVKAVWVKEFAHCFPHVRVWAWPNKSSAVARNIRRTGSPIPEGCEVVVIHYEAMRKWGKSLVDWEPDFVILDEAHRIKSRPEYGKRDGERTVIKGSTAAAIDQLQPKFRAILTGTLVANKPQDVYFPINWAIPGFFPEYWTWLRSIATVGNEWSKKAITEYNTAGLSRLAKQIQSISIRRLKKDVLDLPERMFQKRYVPLNHYQAALYEQCRLGMLGEFQEAYSVEDQPETMNPLTRTLRLAQICANPRILGEDFEDVDSKYVEAIGLIEDCSGQVVVWSPYVQDIARMYQELERVGITAVAICGLVPQDQREQLVKYFHDGSAKVLIATPQSYGTGVTLNCATTMIYLNRNWSHLDRAQSLDRNYRQGQTQSVMVYDLVAPGTIDELILDVLDQKARTMDQLQPVTPKDPQIQELIMSYLANPLQSMD